MNGTNCYGKWPNPSRPSPNSESVATEVQSIQNRTQMTRATRILADFFMVLRLGLSKFYHEVAKRTEFSFAFVF